VDARELTIAEIAAQYGVSPATIVLFNSTLDF
jgi:DNA-binding MurR/RpiR family transcriptional regulator